VFVSIFTQVIELYCTLVFGCIEITALESTVVVPGLAALTVTCPIPYWTRCICVPIGKATEAFVGIEYVCEEAFDAVTSFPESVNTKV
jgi:hypothetical protein